jgi:16S rRNA (cytidine1402-2'-O)-methyltransferase
MPKTNNNHTRDTTLTIAGAGTLYVVSTPIGNLEDITLRALRILKEVDLIAAEDTRHTRKLLTHFGISTPTISYYKEKEHKRSAVIIKKLLEGKNIALVSDAGTPGISDPGSILVNDAVLKNIHIESVPGPSSLTAAISVSGIPDSSFVFLGFAPSRKKQRQDLLISLYQEQKHLIFFEAPHRLEKFIQDCLDILGDRSVVWCRELTKMHEEQTRDTLSAVLTHCKNKKIKGESVLIISGKPTDPPLSERESEHLLLKYRKAGKLSLKDSVKAVTDKHSLSRSAVYNLALKIWKS